MGIKKQLTRKIHAYSKRQKTQPGSEAKMRPLPLIKDNDYIGSQKLKNKVAIVTGGDSGIGHAVAVCFAKEGADIVIAYLNEREDARKVQKEILALGRKCLLISADLTREKSCQKVIKQTIKKFAKLDILVNNAAKQFPQSNIEDITTKQLQDTFSINVFAYFYMIKAALPFLHKGSSIINTSSVTAYKGSKDLLDYSASKGAIVTLTRSLSISLIGRGIRVNGVAPGPIWTPLIPSSFSKKRIQQFGKNVPMKRIGQPEEIAPAYVFLASNDSSFMSGQFLHPNGGVIVNG